MEFKFYILAIVIALGLIDDASGDLYGAKFQTPRPHDPRDPVVYPSDYCSQISQNEEFDFIVVGAGPAGSTIARRLAENPDYRVLLVEAGHDPPAWTDIPNFHIPFSLVPQPAPWLLWQFKTIPSNLCHVFNVFGVCDYNLGKVLGGSSVVNAMMYIRGNQKDYDEWRDQGCPGWGYDDLLPYFKKLENYENNRTTPEFEKYHGQGGPMSISEWPIDTGTAQIRENILQVLEGKGFPINPDFNGASQIGFGNIPGMSEVNGYRCNAAKAYLLHIPDNLKVCKYALVNKVQLSTDKRAEGVHIKYTGGPLAKHIFVRAKKACIVTGGPINTPLLLQRSGIGPCGVLQSAGVPCLHELKGVGKNFQDQYANWACAFLMQQNNAASRNFYTNDLTSFTGFLNINNSTSALPDVQFYLGAFTLSLSDKAGRLRKVFGIDNNLDLITVGPAILRQTNRGTVHIKGTDPLSSPFLDVKQFTSSEEIKKSGDACRLMRKVMDHEIMAKYKPKPFILPPCLFYKRNSDEEILCGARHWAISLYHMAGTTKMGPITDEMAVVDTYGRVHGIKDLWVGDLSVMPDVPRGNTQIPTMAVAEKISDLIKDYYK